MFPIVRGKLSNAIKFLARNFEVLYLALILSLLFLLFFFKLFLSIILKSSQIRRSHNRNFPHEIQLTLVSCNQIFVKLVHQVKHPILNLRILMFSRTLMFVLICFKQFLFENQNRQKEPIQILIQITVQSRAEARLGQ